MFKFLLKAFGILVLLFAFTSPGRSFLTGFMTGLTATSKTVPVSTSEAFASVTTTPSPSHKVLPMKAPAPTPVLSAADRKAAATSPAFRDLNRNTEDYVGETVTYTGTVLQVLENRPLFSESIVYTLRLAIAADNETVIVAKLTYADGTGWRPLADDTVAIWGTVEGREEYKTIMGQQVVLPSITIETIELQ